MLPLQNCSCLQAARNAQPHIVNAQDDICALRHVLSISPRTPVTWEAC